MGTNYYLHRDVCERCGRGEEELHIGKSSHGWTFSFRGYRESKWDGPQIVCEEDWRVKLGEPGSKIRDEYGREVSEKAFWKMVEGKRESKYSSADQVIHDGPEAGPFARDPRTKQLYWIDDRGNSFSETEFC